MRIRSIQAKLVLAVAACMAALVFAITFLVSASSREEQDADARVAVAEAAKAFATIERAEVEKLSATLDAVLANPALRDAFAARDRERLLAAAAPLFGQLRDRFEITHFYFIDPERVCFLRVHRPELFGDVVKRATLARAVETRDVGAGKEIGQTAFALRVVKPLRDGDRILGYVELGQEIDHFLGRVKTVTGEELALAVKKEFLDERAWGAMSARTGRRNSWLDQQDFVVVNATTDAPGLVAYAGDYARLPRDGALLDEIERDGKVFERAVVPVKDAADRVVGGLFVLHDDSENHQRAERKRNLLVGLVTLAAVLLSVALIALLRALVLRRLARMMAKMEEASERLAGGDYEVGEGFAPGADDELGRFEEFFGRFLRVLSQVVRSAAEPRKTG